MRTRVSIIVLSLFIASCNPFISKDLRYKNRCNKKLDRVVKKCPELLSNDTIIDTLVFKIPEVRIDSVIKIERDTTILSLIKNDTIKDIVRHYIINHKAIKDTITIHDKGYTFKFYDKVKEAGFDQNKLHEPVDPQYELRNTRD